MNKKPTKAMILAAGYGTRMRPLSDDVPKAIMPLWNRSLLARNVDLLGGWGVRDILVNTHHGADQVIREAMTLADAKYRITISHEPDILGTGGALRRAEWFFGDEPFWLINADIVAMLDPAPLLRRFRQSRPMAALWMHDTLGPRTVEVARGRVTNFQSREPGTKGTHTFCGLHLVSPRILDYLPESGFASIITAYERAMKGGHRIEAVTIRESYWADVGTPERYLQAHEETAHRFSPDAKRPDVCIAPGARVHRGARLKNCVVWAGAEIAKGAYVEDAVVGRATRVNGPASGVIVRYPLGVSERERNVVTDIFHRCGSAGASPSKRTRRNLEGEAPAEPHTVNVLPARGSARSFVRVYGNTQSVILMRYDPDRTENTYYTRQARFLHKQGWPVPAVLHDEPRACHAILEDVGDDSLLERISALRKPPTPPRTSSRRGYAGHPSKEGIEEEDILPSQEGSVLRRRTGGGSFAASTLYRTIIDHILDLHGPITAAFRRSRVPAMPAFDARVYRYERELFTGHYLCDTLNLDEALIRRIDRELCGVAKQLESARPVLVHRDLQSSNIFWRGNQPIFIDFQGMRLGPAAYDLASLLCDPYVSLPHDLREQLLNDYARRANPKHFSIESYRWACVQRLCQAIGAYARLSGLPGCERFRAYIPAARSLLNDSLREIPGLQKLKILVTASCQNGIQPARSEPPAARLLP